MEYTVDTENTRIPEDQLEMSVIRLKASAVMALSELFLYRARHEGMTIAKFAELLGVSEKHAWKSFDTHHITIEDIGVVAAALDAHIEFKIRAYDDIPEQEDDAEQDTDQSYEDLKEGSL
jgi:hypothetical protein